MRSTVYPAPRGRTEAVSVAGQPALLVDISRDDPTQQQMRELLWRDTATGLVFTMSASGTDAATMVSFAASLHPVSEEEWQAAVAAATATVGRRDPRAWIRRARLTGDDPGARGRLARRPLVDDQRPALPRQRAKDSLCGELAFDGGDMVGSACAETTSSRPTASASAAMGPMSSSQRRSRRSLVSRSSAPAWIRSPSTPCRRTTRRSRCGGSSLRSATHSRSLPSWATTSRAPRWCGSTSPSGLPYPDYQVLESAPKRDLATEVVDGAIVDA